MGNIFEYLESAGCPTDIAPRIAKLFRSSEADAEAYFSSAASTIGGWGTVNSARVWQLPLTWKLLPDSVVAWGSALGGYDLVTEDALDRVPSVVQQYLRAGVPVSYVDGHPFGLELYRPGHIIAAWTAGLTHTEIEEYGSYHVSFLVSFKAAGVPPEYARTCQGLGVPPEYVEPMCLAGAEPAAIARRLQENPADVETIAAEIDAATSFFWNASMLGPSA